MCRQCLEKSSRDFLVCVLQLCKKQRHALSAIHPLCMCIPVICDGIYDCLVKFVHDF